MGAGVASLLSLLIKSQYKNYTIECYAISPPGGVMSKELSYAMSSFCTSLVHGKDIFPRINVTSVENFRNQMVSST